MRNHQFLARWPSGRGTGFIGLSRSLKMALHSTGPLALADHKFEAVPVTVANTTSLRDGSLEAWSTSGSLIGPMFLHVSQVFDTEAEVEADINAAIQCVINSKLNAIDALKREIEILEANKIQLVQP